jgi:uncharacterized protein (DUF927 family)
LEVWAFLRKCAERTAAPPPNSNRNPVPADRLIAMALEQVPQMGRNSAGLWLACQLRDHGYGKDQARDVMAEYRSRCPRTNVKGDSEEYSDQECASTLEQAYSRAARDPWSSTTNDVPPDGAAPNNGAPAESEQPTKRKPPRMKSSRFVVTPKGVWQVDEDDDTRQFVCSHLRVEAGTRDSNGSEWGRLLIFTDSEGREKRWPMPMEILAGDGTELRKELLRGGLVPGSQPKANQLLVQYILSEEPDKLALCVPRLGWNGDDVYVLPDTSISRSTTEGDEIIYQSPTFIQHYYATEGTVADWRERVGSLCRGNSRLQFPVSIAFTAAMLDPLELEGGGFHTYGATSTGKSTSEIVAGSVLGGGNGDHGFCRSWRHTSNGLEAVALLHNDSLLILDELREMADPKEVESCVYMLANGSSKGRMARSGAGTRPTSTWRILFLSSGEFPLSEYAAAAGRKDQRRG